MKNLIFILTLYIFSTFVTFAFCQSPKDSLLQVLSKIPEDTNKVNTLRELGRSLLFSEPDTTKILLEQALKLALDLKFESGLSKIYTNMGVYYGVISQYDSALYWTWKSILLDRQFGDSAGVASAYNNLGIINKLMGNYEQAMKSYLHARRLRDLLGDKEAELGVLNNLGVLADLTGDPEKAMEYYEMHLKVAKELDDKERISRAYTNIGILYYDKGEYDIALDYYFKSLEMDEDLGHKRSMASVSLNIGKVYLDLEDFEQALQYFDKALVLNREMGVQNEIANSLQNIGKTHMTLKDYSRAISFLNEALDIATMVGARQIIRDSEESLSEAYYGVGNYKQAFVHREKYGQMKDSILNESNFERIKKLEAQYEEEKKNNEIVLLTKQSELQEARISKQATLRNALIGGFVLVLIFSTFLVRGYRKRMMAQRLLIEKNKEISDQKIRELEKTQKLNAMHAIVEGQESERIRVAKDLHDGLGGLLSSVKMHFAELHPQGKFNNHEYEKVNVLIDDAYTELRKVAHNMMPDALMKFGLVSALEDLASKLQSDGKLDICVQSIGLKDRLKEGKEIALYRIIQELLNNIIKHSEASEVLIQLSMRNRQLSVIVEDDGKGFDPAMQDGEGMGLKNISSRISYLNGNLNFESSGSGTTVSLDIPIGNPER